MRHSTDQFVFHAYMAQYKSNHNSYDRTLSKAQSLSREEIEAWKIDIERYADKGQMNIAMSSGLCSFLKKYMLFRFDMKISLLKHDTLVECLKTYYSKSEFEILSYMKNDPYWGYNWNVAIVAVIASKDFTASNIMKLKPAYTSSGGTDVLALYLQKLFVNSVKNTPAPKKSIPTVRTLPEFDFAALRMADSSGLTIWKRD